MAFWTHTPPSGIALDLLIPSAHEVGHYLAFRAAGIKVKEVVINKGGGHNTIDGDDDDLTDKQWPGYLVGVMAGGVAERYWCEKHEVALPDYAATYQGDRQLFHELRQLRRKNRQARGLTERHASERALKIVKANWGEIRGLTVQLAKAGRLSRV